MAIAKWHEAELATLATEPGWHYDDSTALEKLATSLRRHGQLRAVVVRTALDGAVDVVDGRKLVQAMRGLGWTTCMVADVGTVDSEASQRLALDLELRFQVDFAKLALAVAGLLENGASPESLAGASPFTAERIVYFRTLASFDWSRFAENQDGQVALDWAEAGPDQLASQPEPLASPPAVEAETEAVRPVEAPESLPEPPKPAQEAVLELPAMAASLPAFPALPVKAKRQPKPAPEPEPEWDGMLF